jgi:EAL domain-containing protein (putative c-di-GMP-specific phosphodiesterase class I)
MRVIAEGVETRGQLEYLRSQGCDEVQGHLYSRALPVDEVEQILRNGRFLEAA